MAIKVTSLDGKLCTLPEVKEVEDRVNEKLSQVSDPVNDLDAVNKRYVDGVADFLDTAIQAEESVREADDILIGKRIDSEVDALSTSISEETSRAESAEEMLDESIKEESERAVKSEEMILTTLRSERDDRIQAETILTNRYNAVQETLDTDVVKISSTQTIEGEKTFVRPVTSSRFKAVENGVALILNPVTNSIDYSSEDFSVKLSFQNKTGILALSSDVVSAVSEERDRREARDVELQTGINSAQLTADEAKSIAQERPQAKVFDTVEEMNAWLAIEENIEHLAIGSQFLIRAINVPDYWWDGNQALELETRKIDLSEYYTRTQTDAAIKVESDRAKVAETNLDTKIDEVETGLLSDISNVESSVSSLQTTVSGLDSSVLTLCSDVTSLQGNVLTKGEVGSEQEFQGTLKNLTTSEYALDMYRGRVRQLILQDLTLGYDVGTTLYADSGTLNFGSDSWNLQLRGGQTRPSYAYGSKVESLALLSDVPDTSTFVTKGTAGETQQMRGTLEWVTDDLAIKASSLRVRGLALSDVSTASQINNAVYAVNGKIILGNEFGSTSVALQGNGKRPQYIKTASGGSKTTYDIALLSDAATLSRHKISMHVMVPYAPGIFEGDIFFDMYLPDSEPIIESDVLCAMLDSYKGATCAGVLQHDEIMNKYCFPIVIMNTNSYGFQLMTIAQDGEDMKLRAWILSVGVGDIITVEDTIK